MRKKHCDVLYGEMDLDREGAGRVEPGSKGALPQDVAGAEREEDEERRKEFLECFR